MKTKEIAAKVVDVFFAFILTPVSSLLSAFDFLKCRLFTVLLLLILPGLLTASGGDAFAFLKHGAGARAMAMGGAYASACSDSSALYYNPGGTVRLSGLELMAETEVLSMGRSLNYVATAAPFTVSGNIYAVGFGWINYSAGNDLEKRLTDSPLPDSTFSDNSNVFIFNVATKLSDRLSLGANFKLFYGNILTYKGTGVGFDIGGLLDIWQGVRAAVAVSNISTNITWNNSPYSETVPVVAAGGISWEAKNAFNAKGFDILTAADLVYNAFSGFKLRLGAEFEGNDFVSARIGWNNGVTAGLGLKLKPSEVLSVKIDYTFMTDQIEPGAFNHRIGACVSYGVPPARIEHKDKTPEPAATGSKQTKDDEYGW